MKQCEKKKRGSTVVKLIDVINKIKSIVAEYVLQGLLQSQLLHERLEFKDSEQQKAQMH